MVKYKMDIDKNNKNLLGDIISIDKVGDEVIITKEAEQEDLKYLKDGGDDKNKDDYVVTGFIEYKQIFKFKNKESALEYYNIQIKRCSAGIEFFVKNIEELESEVMDSKIFEKIDNVVGKLDQNKYKGKYKTLESYLEKHMKYKRCKIEIKNRNRDVLFFEKIIKIISDL